MRTRRGSRWHSAGPASSSRTRSSSRFVLTLGLRMERNPYTGWEALPNARIGYSLAPDSLLWATLSRAVRSPARFDREIVDLAVAVRHVGRLPAPEIPSYAATDVTVNWNPRSDLRLTAGVRNAFDRGHAEYQGFSTVSEIPRSAFVALSFSMR